MHGLSDLFTTGLISALSAGLVVVAAQEVLRRYRLPKLLIDYGLGAEYCTRTPYYWPHKKVAYRRVEDDEERSASTSIQSTGYVPRDTDVVAGLGVGTTATRHSSLIRFMPVQMPGEATEAIYIRVKVTNAKPRTQARNCRAYITHVTRNNPDGSNTEIASQDAIQMPWSLRDGAVDAIDIPSGINQFADICFTVSASEAATKLTSAAPIFPYRLQAAWEGAGTFQVTVVITADDVAPVSKVIKFDWRGKWDSLRAIAPT